MTISIINIGTGGGAGTSISVTGANVPANSLIVVIANELNANNGAGSVSDGVNTYILATSETNNGNGLAQIYYAANATLSSGTITYTLNQATSPAAMSAFYATGIATNSPLDTAVTAVALGFSSSPSVISGEPGGSGEMFVGVVSQAGTATFTQAAGWVIPPNASGSSVGVSGGTLIGNGQKQYSPSLSTTVDWAAMIVGFKPSAGSNFAGAGAINAAVQNFNAGKANFSGSGLLTGRLQNIGPFQANAFLSGAGGLNTRLFSLDPIAAVFSGFGQLNAFATSFVPVPPVPIPRFAYKNIFAFANYQAFLGAPSPAPSSAPVKVFVNEPANLFLDLGASNLPGVAIPNVLNFTRPDGSAYLVPASSPSMGQVTYTGKNYLFYRTAARELNQPGWWQVIIESGVGIPTVYVFYIWPA